MTAVEPEADGAEFEVGRLRGSQAAELEGQGDRARSLPSHQFSIVWLPLLSLRVSHDVGEISVKRAASRGQFGESRLERIRSAVRSAFRLASFSSTSPRSRLAAIVFASAGQGFFGSLISTLAGGAGR